MTKTSGVNWLGKISAEHDTKKDAFSDLFFQIFSLFSIRIFFFKKLLFEELIFLY